MKTRSKQASRPVLPGWNRALPDSIISRGAGLVRCRLWPGKWASLRVVLVWALLWWDAGGETPVAGGDVKAAPVVEWGPFQRFLANPPWIKHVRFRRSGNHYFKPVVGEPARPEKVHPKERLGGWVFYEGALQPAGYYLRHLAEGTSPLYLQPDLKGEFHLELPRPGEEWIIGVSDRYFWFLDYGHERLSLAPRRPEEGQSSVNGPEIISETHERPKLETLRRLGMPELVDAEVTWPAADRFEAISRRHGVIVGRITRGQGERVEALEYQVSPPVGQRIQMHYAYSPGKPIMPPVEMVRTVPEGNGLISFTNRVDLWEEGLDPGHPQGFKPSEFRQKSEPLKAVMISSNGTRYQLTLDGVMAKMNERPPDYGKLEDLASSRLLRGYFFAAWAGLLGLSLYWYVRSARANKS